MVEEKMEQWDEEGVKAEEVMVEEEVVEEMVVVVEVMVVVAVVILRLFDYKNLAYHDRFVD